MLMRIDSAIAALALAVAFSAVDARPFRWASQGDPQTIDPHSQNELLTNSVNGQMYETLVNRGKKLEIVPVLATEWKQIDPLTWRFTLRKGVRFHDGTPFTADDVLFSVQRASQATSQIRVYATARLAWKRERFDPKARVVERTAGAAGGERPSGKGQKPEKRGHEREGRASPAPAGKTAQEAASWTGAGITSSSGRHDGTAGLLDRGGGWIELGVPVGHQEGGQQCVLGLSVAVLVIDRHLRLLVSMTGFRFRSPGSIANCLRSAAMARN